MSRVSLIFIVGYAAVAGFILDVTGVAEMGPETYFGWIGVIIIAVHGALWDAQEGP